MDKRIKKEWIRRLKSGYYKQGRNYLRQEKDGKVYHCCLGVLCEMAVEAGVIKKVGTVPGGIGADVTEFLPHQGNEAATAVLPQAVSEWSGVPGETGGLPKNVNVNGECTLAAINDRGSDFKTIAKIIKEHL